MRGIDKNKTIELFRLSRPAGLNFYLIFLRFLQKVNKFGRVSRQARKCRDGFAVRFQNHVKRERDGLKVFFL